MKAKVCLLALAMVAVAVVAAAPAVEACGFNEEFVDYGGVRVYMECTMVHAEVGDDALPLP